MQINFMAILIADLMGLTILYSVIIGKAVGLKQKTNETALINILIYASIISCLIDPLCFYLDGKTGTLCNIILYSCNTLVYILNLTIVVSWFMLIIEHFGYKLTKTHKIVILSISIACVLLLIVNLFTPIIFEIDGNDSYSRKSFFWVFTGLNGLLYLDGIVLYMFIRHRSDKLKFFPVLAFTLPSIVGIVMQLAIYGISTITPFVAISISCMTLCLQNELIFRDNLTGLFNRFYIDKLQRSLQKSKHSEFSAIMLDINSFKLINDTYGHKAGDEALQDLAKILKGVIRERGIVIRYAGDEFIVLTKTLVEKEVKAIITNIHKSVAEYNQESNNQFDLSIACGYSRVSFKEEEYSQFIDKVDKLMYEDKRGFYNSMPKTDE